MLFYTEYYVGDVSYSSFIYAKNRSAADQIVKSRNISEKIIGELIKTKAFDPSPLPSDFYLERQLIECLHTLTFYGWLAGRAKVTCIDRLLRDDGVLHEVMHEVHFPKQYEFRQHVYVKMVELEGSIPGLTSYTGKGPYIPRGVDRRSDDRRTA